MNVRFFFCDNFPGTSAYSNRFHSLSKGLLFYCNTVEVSVVYPGVKKKSLNINSKIGIYDKVPYKYYCGVKYKPKNRFLQILIALYGIGYFLIDILIRSRKSKPDFIISGSSNLLHVVVLYMLGKLKRIKILREKNELPLYLLKNKKTIAPKSRYKLFDGFIFMTKVLSDYFINTLNIKKPTIIINMTVDTDRFNKTKHSVKEKYEYILLVGDILGNKDGVGSLIKSFNIVHKEVPEIKLLLVGNISNTKLYEKRKNEIVSYGLEDHVIFKGEISRESIPDLIINAKLLVLPRPSSTQATYGFPTKLGEYLASGIPTIVTKTGEISGFLKDNIHAFLVTPDDHILFANKILYALNNYNLATSIGQNGRKLAYEIFGYKKQGKILHEFLLNMLK